MGTGTVNPAQDAQMPEGDLPGWRQVFADDFDVNIDQGQSRGRTQVAG